LYKHTKVDICSIIVTRQTRHKTIDMLAREWSSPET